MSPHAAEVAGQTEDPVPDESAVDVEPLPPEVGGEPRAEAVESAAARMDLARLLRIELGRAGDAEAPVDQRRDIEREPAPLAQIKAADAVHVEALVLAEKAHLTQEQVVLEHRVEVRPRRARGVVHHPVGDEQRLALVAVLEQPEELRGQRVRHDRQPVHLAGRAGLLFDLDLGVEDELAVGGVREVRRRVDLARHEHRAVHVEAPVPADHRHAAHLHRRRAQEAQQLAEVRHEEGFLAEAELLLGEVSAGGAERHGANLPSLSPGDSEYSKIPPTTRTARLSIRVLIHPSSLTLPTRPSGRAALGIWKPIRWNCSPKLFRRGGRVWHTLH